jgi:HK97 family phage portal protein
MTEYVTPGGLIVTDRRHHRASSEQPQIDPREHEPNANLDVGSTVGSQARAGEVMTGRWHAQAWDGWPDGWDTPYMDGGESLGGGPGTLISKTATAMTCVDLNSRQVGSFPVYGLKGTEPYRLPPWHENPCPALYQSWVEFMHGTINALLIRGEAFTYALARYSDGFPASFANLNPDAVRVEWMGGRREYLVEDVPVAPDDICHIQYQSWPGRLHGVSPLEWCARSILTSASLERYASNLSTRGGVPWAVLKAQRNLDEAQVTDAQAAWVSAAMRRDGAPAILGSAFDLQPLSFSPEQMALLDLREFDDRRICAAFGVPGYLVNVSMGEGSSVTYANASALFQHHWNATLRPLCNLIAKAWSGWLVPRGSQIEFNPDRYTQNPLSERAFGYQTLFNIVDPVTGERGMYVDEIRAAERLPNTKPHRGASLGPADPVEPPSNGPGGSVNYEQQQGA